MIEDISERNYRGFVGPQKDYYTRGASFFLSVVHQTNLKTSHNLVDIGCGSLRVGRHLIPFLEPNKYHGIDPSKKQIEEGLKHELSSRMVDLKSPRFYYGSDFDFSQFGVEFDVAIATQVFIHCGTDQMRECLSNLYGCLSPEGCVLLSVQIGDETEAELWPPNFVGYKGCSHQKTVYEINYFNDIVRSLGFESERVPPSFFPSLSETIPHVGFLLHKKEQK